jgi:membrane protein implicated in regulation of membrane protease activity
MIKNTPSTILVAVAVLLAAAAFGLPFLLRTLPFPLRAEAFVTNLLASVALLMLVRQRRLERQKRDAKAANH